MTHDGGRTHSRQVGYAIALDVLQVLFEDERLGDDQRQLGATTVTG